MSTINDFFCVVSCIPHPRLRRAWVVKITGSEKDLPIKSVLSQERNSKLFDGSWTVVGWSTAGEVILEPEKGMRDNMLPGDRFRRIL